MINTVIRTHIKNEKRLGVLKRTIDSWYDKKLNDIGELYIIDDGSPMKQTVKELANSLKIKYKLAEGEPDTKNGLVQSLKLQKEDEILLCCVDDMVFGKGISDRIKQFEEFEYNQVKNTMGLFGLFAAYDDSTRKINSINGNFWRVPIDIYYATVCHIFSPKLSNILKKEWDKILNKEIEMPQMCDDIWVKEICRRENISIFNSYKDYAQHIGMNLRTFGENEVDNNSEYQTPCFIGE